MFIGQRSAAMMPAAVYMQIKWLKNLSTMENVTQAGNNTAVFSIRERI